MVELLSLVYDRLWFTNMVTMSNSGGKLWLFTILSCTGCWSVVVDVYLWIDNTKMNINSSVVNCLHHVVKCLHHARVNI